MGLKKALQKERNQNLLVKHLISEDKITMKINEDGEYWIYKVNGHLDKLLDKANMDSQMLRHMAHHYQTRNKICNIKVKQMKNRLKETLKGKGEMENMDMLVEASMIEYYTSFGTFGLNLGAF